MLTIKPTFVIRMIINRDGDMKLYEHKYMDFVLKKVFVAPFMDSKIIGKEPGTDYDNAFMKTYDEAVAWLNR